MDFSLIDEPWIPVNGSNRKSLMDIFSEDIYVEIGDSPLQKIALFKLLLAISQAACTPENEDEWKNLGPEDLASSVRNYLMRWKNSFNLYGDDPFLQIPAIKNAESRPIQSLNPEISSGNTTVLFSHSRSKAITDADKVLLLLITLNFGFTGKLDNSIVLTKNYQGKNNAKGNPSTGAVSPALGAKGYLHSWIMSDSLWTTLWLNLWTQESMKSDKMQAKFPKGIGIAPWEKMPAGENDVIAKDLKDCLLGRLVPLGRFCLIDDTNIHCSEGIVYPDIAEGNSDTTCALKMIDGKFKVMWTDPTKKPWREIISILRVTNDTSEYECLQTRMCLYKHINTLKKFGYSLPIKVWSGGLKVSPGTGKQFLSGTDDYVESVLSISMDNLSETWFNCMKSEIDLLEKRQKQLYGCVLNYGKDINLEIKKMAAMTSQIFWENCEKYKQKLIDACFIDGLSIDHIEKEKSNNLEWLRRKFYSISCQIFDAVCPYGTSRQMVAWVKNRPVYQLKRK